MATLTTIIFTESAPENYHLSNQQYYSDEIPVLYLRGQICQAENHNELIQNQKINITVNGVACTSEENAIMTNNDGEFNIPLNMKTLSPYLNDINDMITDNKVLKIGNNNIVFSYDEDSTYAFETQTYNLNVINNNSITLISNVNSTTTDANIIINGFINTNETITAQLYHNTETETITIDTSGIFEKNYENLTKGTHYFFVTYNINNRKTISNILIIQSQEKIIFSLSSPTSEGTYYANDTPVVTLSGTLTDIQNHTIEGQKLSITVNGKPCVNAENADIVTNNDGTFNIPLNISNTITNVVNRYLIIGVNTITLNVDNTNDYITQGITNLRIIVTEHQSSNTTATEIQENIINLATEIPRFAATKNHNHDDRYVAITEEGVAPTNHASDTNIYGTATTTKYGHVILTNDIEDAIDDAVPTVSATKQYITELISQTNIFNDYSIINSNITSSTPNSNKKIPTAQSIYNTIDTFNILPKLTQHTLTCVQDTTDDINNIIDSGYYHKTNNGTFTHAPDTIYYTDGIIEVLRYDTRAIQKVYTTVKNSNNNYRFNGAVYIRYGVVNDADSSNNNTPYGDWDKWHVLYMPWTERNDLIGPLGTGVDVNSISLWENTDGFTIRWKQTQTNQQYTVSANKGNYAKICEFKRDLPIKGPFVFGNIINNMDIKIQSDGVYLRTTEINGGTLSGIDETYFVPRVN